MFTGAALPKALGKIGPVMGLAAVCGPVFGGLLTHGTSWRAVFFAVMTGLMLVVVVHLQVGLGASPMTTGLTLLPWSIGLAEAAWLAGVRLGERFGDRLM